MRMQKSKNKNTLDKFLYCHSPRKAQFIKMYACSMILLFLSGTVALSFPSQVVLEILLEVPRIIHVEDGRHPLYDVYWKPIQSCRFDVKQLINPLMFSAVGTFLNSSQFYWQISGLPHVTHPWSMTLFFLFYSKGHKSHLNFSTLIHINVHAGPG